MTDVVFRNAAVLDPDTGTIDDGATVRVRDGRIVDDDATAGETIDLAGRVLMPGLCDAHVHVTASTPDFAKLSRWSPFYVAATAGDILGHMLQRGFTTVRDCGGADHGLARAVEERFFDGPRLLFGGKALSQTGGHGDMRGPGESVFEDCLCCAGLGRICDGVAEVRRACRDEIRRGATHIKLMVAGGVSSPTDRITSTQFSIEELKAAVEEAEAALLPVAAHAYTARAVNRALDCGVTSIEHGNLIDETSVAKFKERDAFLVPTLITYRSIAEEGVQAGMPAELVAKVYEVLDAGLKALEMAHKAGVKIVFGSDLLGTMHRRQLEEFLIRSAVVPAPDLVRQATVNAARLFRLDGEIGAVRPGFRADLLVVDGNPLDDIGVLTDPEQRLRLVMKDGRIHRNRL